MLLESIKLENFRQFLNEHIDFSTDKDKNVTLIIGDNGTGKTTFLQAFYWCLYGSAGFNDKVLLNRAVAEKMTPDETKTVKVTICLIHGSAHYQIERKQEYNKKYSSNRVEGSNTVLNISIRSADGNTRYLKPLECEAEIQKILPKELASYFFFDGERIGEMSKAIETGRKNKGFENAVNGLTGLNATLAALDHLSPSKTNSVIGKLNKEYVGDSDGRIHSLNSEIDNLQLELNRIASRLKELDDNIEAAKESKNHFEKEITQYAEGEKLQNERDRLQRDLLSAEKTKSQFVQNLISVFHGDFTQFISLSLVGNALNTLSESDFGGKDIPEMHAKTVKYLINRGTCICGTQLMEGTLPYKNVLELMDYLPPQSIGVTVGQFTKDSRNMYLNATSMTESIYGQMRCISSQNDAIDEIKNELALIEEKLDGKNVGEKVRQLNAQIKACMETVRNCESEKENLLIQQGGKESEKRNKENSRSELSLLNANNIRIERLKAYAERIYSDLLKDYKNKETEIRNKLEQYINEFFKAIYNGGLSLSIDEKYNVSVYASEYVGDVETSTAQGISVVFAFISSIIRLAKENQQENGDEAYSEPYPLVMDAPLSAFDKKRIEAVCKAIPDTAEQVIIFIKDTDGELVEEHLAHKVKTRHCFEKIDEFNTKLI